MAVQDYLKVKVAVLGYLDSTQETHRWHFQAEKYPSGA